MVLARTTTHHTLLIGSNSNIHTNTCIARTQSLPLLCYCCLLMGQLCFNRMHNQIQQLFAHIHIRIHTKAHRLSFFAVSLALALPFLSIFILFSFRQVVCINPTNCIRYTAMCSIVYVWNSAKGSKSVC